MVILSDDYHSASTSTTANSLKRKRNYDDDRFDVFLSFRGLDTRNGFTDHLYHHLKRADILTFRDNDELERGEALKKQLEKAIEQSSVSIIVFSKNYASSSWCLDEVVRILEQKKIRGDGYKVIPIFYKVNPMVILSDHDHSATTTNSLKRKRNYDDDRFDVFLSFRGLDTRNGFTDHLYHHLKRANILTFRDNEELERGEALKKQLEKAIEQSSVSIIVFSKNYASSSWCLDEVVSIFEQKMIRGDCYKIVPVFYHVEVSDVRYQKGSYKEAFDQHIAKGYVSLEKIEAWKAVLNEAANLVGLTLNNNEPETEFIDEIVSEVENNLPNRKVLDVPECLVGMDYRAQGIDSWIKDRSTDKNVLVIYGIGGIGKTTIAKHYFNQYFRDFEGSCFLARITTRWGQNHNGVCGLQSQLLSNIRNKKEEIIQNCDKGTEMLKKALRNRKVLVVLDDVSETEQLEALLGQPQRLHPGSKIIVTTRNMSLQKDFIIRPIVHNVQCLYDEESLKLFSWHAFRQVVPLEEYMQLSKEILLRCGGLPLALEVLGSSLRKKLDTIFWKKQLEKMDEIAKPGIQKVMQISYDSLEDNTVKNIFLHIACFFVGEEEDYVITILDHCGLHATVGIQYLIDRCLVTKVGCQRRLMMHQIIQDMGREIVRQECPNEPGRRSRLWYHEDSFTVLKYDKGSEMVQGLILDGQKINKVEFDESSVAASESNQHLMTRFFGYVKKKKEDVIDRFLQSKEGELRIDAFAKMVNLKLMKLNHVHLTGSCNNFPKELRWISWHEFPLEYVPRELSLDNLVALDLQHSLLKQVWKGYMEVKSLKFLNLSYSLELYQTPDFTGLLQLKKLILTGCSNLVKVCKTIGILQGLVLLDLRYCKSLTDLPCVPKSLLMLDLSGCLRLGEFPREQEEVNNWYRIVKYASPSISRGPVKLFAYLPRHLVKLSLEGCNLSDDCFPADFSGLSSLESLDLSRNLITALPRCVRCLSDFRLSSITLMFCLQLISVVYDLYPEDKKQLQRTKTRLGSKHFRLITEESVEYIENRNCFIRVVPWDVDFKVLKNLSLESVPIRCIYKVLLEFGIFSTFFQSAMVPPCFKIYYISYTDEEEDSAKLLYTIPSSDDRKIQGLNICLLRRLDPIAYPISSIYVTVCNKTKDLAWTYTYMDMFAALLRPWEEYIWVSTWKCADLLEPGDEIQVTFKFFYPDGLKNLNVKECGIRIVYEDDLSEDRNCNLIWSEHTDVSWNNCRTPGTHYFLLGLYFEHMDIKEETHGREVQFVGWYGPNQNWRKELLRYSLLAYLC